MFGLSDVMFEKQFYIDIDIEQPFLNPINNWDSSIDCVLSGARKINQNKKHMLLIKQCLLKQKIALRINEENNCNIKNAR